MKWSYRCPHCKALLNPGATVMLVGIHDDQRLLVGFHPEPGNYEIFFPPECALKEGDIWQFLCPVCQVDLLSNDNDSMCALELLEGDNEPIQVLFSRVAGQQATFIVNQREVQSYGTHAADIYKHLAMLR